MKIIFSPQAKNDTTHICSDEINYSNIPLLAYSKVTGFFVGILKRTSQSDNLWVIVTAPYYIFVCQAYKTSSFSDCIAAIEKENLYIIKTP